MFIKNSLRFFQYENLGTTIEKFSQQKEKKKCAAIYSVSQQILKEKKFFSKKKNYNLSFIHMNNITSAHCSANFV